MADLEIGGMGELSATLSALPEKLVINILRSSLRKAANVIADGARANFGTGDGPESISGALAASIRVMGQRGTPTKAAVSVVAGVLTGAQTKKFGVQSAFYALMVEKGHLNLASGQKLRGGGRSKLNQRIALKAGGATMTPPHPFMRPAIEQRGQAALDVMIADIENQLQGLVT